MDTVERKLISWLASGHTGISSKTIAFTMLGIGYPRRSHPYDPADFNRCLLLLDAVPEIRPQLPKMASVSDKWRRLVERWGEVEALFIKEAGFDWRNSRSAPKTYKLMKEILDGPQD